ncbi:efflux RND transporter periplasmic adaptor subunit [Flammeovirga pectinis]|uniref:Efflux RND transporter periplasmic adaptor subunit n=1 Tax=Flammeovirga pectinis TaxID=2494373 RepID=A0A3S9P9P8_9BACT|nr:efflux RND transporter periplasmic adaptor subunit [Flammeovirga pectinis]AZQ64945.1 efflux RND transporter periplasmic adaptor subunit [Flammeovirga pectinis]
MKNTKVIYLFLCVFILNISCSKVQIESKKEYRKVRYLKIENTKLVDERAYSGYAIPSLEMELSFRSNGTIIEKNVKVGQKVTEGDLLMKLDNIQAQLSYEQSLSALNSAKSEMYTAKSEYKRGKILYEKGNYSLSKYESVKNKYENANSQLSSAVRKLAIDKEKIKNGYIYAPKNGIIAALNANLNEMVSTGEAVIVLNAGQEINVMVGVSEKIINQIKVGTSAQLNFKSNNEIIQGNVIEVSPIMEADKGTFPVKINLSSHQKKVYPGMVADVFFEFSANTNQSQLLLPISAIGEDQDGNFVYVIRPTRNNYGTVYKKQITIGGLKDQGIVITDGISEGQLVVTAGLHTLLPGQTVKL